MKSQLVKEWRGGSKIIAATFLIISALSSPLTFAANGPDDTGRADYDLDNDGLIEINDLADLDEIRHNLNGTSLYSANTGCPAAGCIGFELIDDLDFDTNQDGIMDASDDYWHDNGRDVGEGWLPIGYLSEDGDSPFTAIFEGNSNTISNLYIDRENMSYIGLFGAISDSEIRNISLSGTLTSVTGDDNVALLVGRVELNSKIFGSYTEGTVHGDSHVGGLAGYVADSELTGLSFLGKVYATNYGGGLVGTADNNNKVYSCNSKGTVQGRSHLGGLIGAVGNNNEIEKSYSTVDVIGAKGVIGGLLGTVDDNNQIKYCFSVGSVRSERGYWRYGNGGLIASLGSDNQVVASYSSSTVEGSIENTGGLIGQLQSNNLISASYSTGLVTGYTATGGLIGNVANSGNTISISYWATDTSDQPNSSDESETLGYVGLPSAKLQCATQADTNANNSNCLSEDGRDEGLTSALTLYKDWNSYELDGVPVWDFGSNGQFPGLNVNGIIYRDSDGDGSLDEDDVWPLQRAASLDEDLDGYPDSWHPGCNTECKQASGLVLDHFPNDKTGGKDSDFDGLLDEWPANCDEACQETSSLTIDDYPNDFDNDNNNDIDDLDDNDDGIVDIDADSNGLIDIHTLTDLNAMRYQLDGAGYKANLEAELNKSGCPYTSIKGVYTQACFGYELKTNLDFDSNQNGVMDTGDAYWNANDDGVGEGWLPIGSSFRSIFEGNNYVIRNLYINRENADYVGLFSSLSEAQVRNLTLDGPLMAVTGDRYVGGLAGRGLSNNIISNSLVGGDVRGTYYVGGFIGRSAAKSQIINSRSVGSVHALYAAGGLIGYAQENTEIKSSYNSGYISASNTSGGLIGHADTSIKITTSFNTGPVKGYWNAGGLVGSMTSNNHIEGSFSTGQVIGSEDVGGLLGAIEGESNLIKDSYWATDASKQVISAGSSAVNYPGNEGYFGVPLATLQCAVQADSNDKNSLCIPKAGLSEGYDSIEVLYQNWNKFEINTQPVWDFGNDQQLPALSINGVAFRDSDGDGLLDDADTYPYDTDNDNSSNLIDPFPFISAANLDTDGDGKPDAWLDGCDSYCQYLTGLELDNDDDNDGLLDEFDTDINTDNGLPELTKIPEEINVSVDSEDGTFVISTWDVTFFEKFEAYDVVDVYNLRYEASLNGEVLAVDDVNQVELPSGRLQIDWVAIDTAGNRSNVLSQIVNVYPQVYFELSHSVTGDNSVAEITVALTGEAPEYPVMIKYKVNHDLSDAQIEQNDFLNSFNSNAIHQVSIEVGSNLEALNTKGQLLIPISDNDASEYDEDVILDLIDISVEADKGKNYSLDSDRKQHTLTIAYQNIAPQVQLLIQQNGKNVNSINPKGGEVTITAVVTDGNDVDEHTLEWNVNELSLAPPLDRVLVFNPENIIEGDYVISVTATDSGNNNLSTTLETHVKISKPKSDDDSLGIGSLWWLTLLLTGATVRRRHRR